jgi:hypothetical protein
MKQAEHSGAIDPGRVTGACLMALVPVLLAACPLSAQTGGPYELYSATVDSGGATSSAGSYTLSGTAGQPDAGQMTGGNYELSGGFWPAGVACLVEFEDYSRFAEQWLATGSGLDADLDGDQVVDAKDLRQFADEWLGQCAADWPLK